ncbi:MAG: hypothetical protein AB7F96_22740 [Beijerinckiaceae bacterium]
MPEYTITICESRRCFSKRHIEAPDEACAMMAAHAMYHRGDVPRMPEVVSDDIWGDYSMYVDAEDGEEVGVLDFKEEQPYTEVARSLVAQIARMQSPGDTEDGEPVGMDGGDAVDTLTAIIRKAREICGEKEVRAIE